MGKISQNHELVSQRPTNWSPAVQVHEGFYSSGYDDWDKWVTYHWVIRNVLAVGAKEVLEIGVGSGVVAYCLRKNGVKVTTLDLDPSLEPDHVGSVTEMPFLSNAFDAVLCTEVLEHMPIEHSQKGISEIFRVTRRHAFISVPHFTLSFAFLMRAPILQLRELRLRLPYPKRLRPNGQHFWECGRPGYPVRRLRRAFEEVGFDVTSEHRPPTNYSSCFFALEKQGVMR